MLKHPLFLMIDGMSQAYRAYFAITTRAVSATTSVRISAAAGGVVKSVYLWVNP